MTSPTKTDQVFWESFTPDRGLVVSEEWAQELYNYLVLGFPPGSFHYAVFANDLMGAAVRSHRANTWSALMAMCRWIINVGPDQAFGSYEKVQEWLELSNEQRRKILEEKRLLTPEKDVVWNILKEEQ